MATRRGAEYDYWQGRPILSRDRPLPIPAIGICDAPAITICVNEEWSKHVIQALEILARNWAWEGTLEEQQNAVRQVEGLIRAMEICGCSGQVGVPNGTLLRVADSGAVQQSTDDGVTWEDAPQFDPRLTSPLFPPLPTGVSDTTRCAAAENIVTFMQHTITDASNALEVGATITGLVLEAIVLFMSAGVLAAFATPILSAMTAAGGAALAAAFTTDVYDKLRCCFYCSLNDSGELTGLQPLLDCINADISGLANVVSTLMVKAMYPNGLVNAGRGGAGSGDSCDCDCSCATEEQYNATEDFWSGSAVVANGSFMGRNLTAGTPLTLEIPDRDGRTINSIYVNWSGAAGSGALTVTAGATDSDESPVTRTGLENPLHTFSTSVDDDTVVLSVSSSLTYHITYVTVHYDC